MERESLCEDGSQVAGERPRRLTKRAEFRRVSRGRRVSAASFTLQSQRRENAEIEARRGARFGFTASKRIGNAVERSRIRRRLREALRAALPLETLEDHDYVLVARRDALTRRFAALVEDLRHTFRVIGRVRSQGARASARKTARDRDKRK